MRRQILLPALLLVVLAVVQLKLKGLQIAAEPGAFVPRPGSRVFEPGGRMHVQFDPAPGKVPGWLPRAAGLGVPVTVAVPFEGRTFEFRITDVSRRGELVAPCKTRGECAQILTATGLALPPELAGAP